MKNNKLLLLIFSFFFFLLNLPTEVCAQGITAFKDVRDRFYIFDNGVVRQIEHLPPKEYAVGRNYVVYIDNADHLKIYYNGTVQTIEQDRPHFFYATDFLMVYRRFNDIYALYRNRIETVARWVESDIVITDSLIVFNDHLGFFQLFQYGITNQLESWSVPFFDAKNNVVIYNDRNDFLKAVYRGNVMELNTYGKPSSYGISKNTVAYIDYMDNFNVFHKGEITLLESFKPLTFSVGFDMVAYVNSQQNFNVFYNGEIYELMQSRPSMMQLEQNIMVYADQSNHFNVFYNGESRTLEYYIPESFYIDRDMLVYKDLDNKLIGFINGEKKVLYNQNVTSYELSNNVVMFKRIPHHLLVYFDGQVIQAF